MNILEVKDKALFNSIGENYSKKDIHIPSLIARKFQIDTMVTLLKKKIDISKAIKVLDIGCGHGATAMYLKSFYGKYLGLDYSQEMINIATHRYGDDRTNFVCNNIKNFNQIQEYNIVIGVGVLHHITELRDTLSWLKKSCLPGTVFAFNEPQRGNPIIQILRKIRKKIDKNYSEDQSFFTKKELRSLFEQAGFTVESISYIGYFSTPFAQVILKPALIFKPLSKWCIFIDKWLQNKINSKLAWNMIIIAS